MSCCISCLWLAGFNPESACTQHFHNPPPTPTTYKISHFYLSLSVLTQPFFLDCAVSATFTLIQHKWKPIKCHMDDLMNKVDHGRTIIGLTFIYLAAALERLCARTLCLLLPVPGFELSFWTLPVSDWIYSVALVNPVSLFWPRDSLWFCSCLLLQWVWKVFKPL